MLSRWVLAVLAAGALAYAFVPMSELVAELWYDGVAIGAIGLAILGLRRNRPSRGSGWTLLLVGYGGWVLGDLAWGLEQQVFHLESYPVPSDAVYLSAYLSIAAGALALVRTRREGRDVTALLDAMIITAGVAVLMAVFVIAPLATDSDLSTFGKVVSSAYPVADLLLLAIIARMWAGPGARTMSYRLLISSLAIVLLGDLAWSLSVILTADIGKGDLTTYIGGAWLFGYILLGAAVCVPSVRTLGEPALDLEQVATSRRRLVALACGLTLPAAALLLDGATGGGILWSVIGIGSILLSVLVLVRMAGLLQIVQLQAVQLAALSRADALTGAPNRRSWDFELSRACSVSLEEGSPLCVAMIDMDWFKAYNDANGHQAGDRLLCEAVAAWTERLGAGAVLARYGGEEFAVLLPGVALDEALTQIENLRAVTPDGQTFSAGVTLWNPQTDPSVAVACADEALYEAKRTGRDRVIAWGTASSMTGKGKPWTPSGAPGRIEME